MSTDINPFIVTAEEETIFSSLRSVSWDEFFGQEKIKKSLNIAIQAAKKRKEAIEHVLLYGPPGLGKTTLAHLIAKDMGVAIKVTSGPAITRSGDLAAILTNLEKGDILFIDEIHRLNKMVEETLYPAMEDFCLDVIVGKGPSARTIRLDLPQFTVIGATTRIGLISAPLRDRFGVVHRLHFYDPEHLYAIIQKAAEKLQVKIDADSVASIAKRSRGTPRIALKLLKRARDMAQVHGKGEITALLLQQTFDLIEIDSFGLDNLDIRFLQAIITTHKGGPVGIETIAATVAEDTGTLEDVVEPYLLQIGFLQKTPRGRVATQQAYAHFNLPFPQSTS